MYLLRLIFCKLHLYLGMDLKCVAHFRGVELIFRHAKWVVGEFRIQDLDGDAIAAKGNVERV